MDGDYPYVHYLEDQALKVALLRATEKELLALAALAIAELGERAMRRDNSAAQQPEPAQ